MTMPSFVSLAFELRSTLHCRKLVSTSPILVVSYVSAVPRSASLLLMLLSLPLSTVIPKLESTIDVSWFERDVNANFLFD